MAFDELRTHNSSGEPYFLELSYKLTSDIACKPIAVDENGRAHVFEPVTTTVAVSLL